MKHEIPNILHISTHDEECGIAIYQQNIVDAMGAEQHVRNVFFEPSPNKLKLLKGKDFDAKLDDLARQLKDFDVLHIQHEYTFFADDQLQRIVNVATALRKKILFTLHTPPHARKEHLQANARIGLHPRSWVRALRDKRAHRRFLRTYIQPLSAADMLIVPSKVAKDSFVAYGLDAQRIKVIALPVPAVNKKSSSNEIAQALHKKPGDVILANIGFISETKGVTAAIKALTFLPDSYKLAIIGGAHPSGLNNAYYDEICDLIIALGLRERVYITGYVVDDDRRDALAREADIALYPYDATYYNYVSSAAVMNAVANDLPVVAYRTLALEEVNHVVPFITFCHSPNYYELARTVQNIDHKKGRQLSREYADRYTSEKQAAQFAECYKQLVKN